jgi:parvulin-like peptidyl-prolyl isomerase
LVAFYQQNIDSLYTTKKTYEVHEIYIENKALAEQVLALARKTDDYKKLSDKFTERYKKRPKKGYLGFITADKYSNIGKTAARTEPGAVYPELIKSGQGYSIIKVLSVKEPVPIPFEENTNRIFSDYYKHKFPLLKQELIDQLKDTYTYKFDRSKLN